MPAGEIAELVVTPPVQLVVVTSLEALARVADGPRPTLLNGTPVPRPERERELLRQWRETPLFPFGSIEPVGEETGPFAYEDPRPAEWE